MRMFNEAEPPWSKLSEILGLINVLTKFENDPWKIMDVRVLTGLVCPAACLPARPPARSGYDSTPEPLRAAGWKLILKCCLQKLSILFTPQTASLTQSLATDMRRLFYSTWPPSLSQYFNMIHLSPVTLLIGISPIAEWYVMSMVSARKT